MKLPSARSSVHTGSSMQHGIESTLACVHGILGQNSINLLQGNPQAAAAAVVARLLVRVGAEAVLSLVWRAMSRLLLRMNGCPAKLNALVVSMKAGWSMH